jgi:two-component system chemotaxis response regulator CheY
MSTPAPTILVVDDDAFVLAVLRDLLEEQGAHVVEARDGDEALAVAEREKPALVFLDLVMPNRSGLEALPELLRRNPGTRVLVVSSFDAGGLVDEARRLGAAGFIAKPFHPLEIARAVREQLPVPA